MLNEIIRRILRGPAPDQPASTLASDTREIPSPVESQYSLLGAQFEYSRSTRWSLGYAYFDEQNRTCAAVGKSGWVPLQVLMLRLVSETLVRAEINEAFYMGTMDPNDPAMLSWLDANLDCFVQLTDVLISGDDQPWNNELGEREAQDDFTGFTMMEAVAAYADAWACSHPRSEITFLSASPRRYAFYNSPVMSAYKEAVKTLADRSHGWAATWLQSRGIEVDMEQMLVRLDRYEPLFVRLNVGY